MWGLSGGERIPQRANVSRLQINPDICNVSTASRNPYIGNVSVRRNNSKGNKCIKIP